MSRGSRMRSLRPVALALALTYAALGVIAYACPAEVRAAHVHHGDHHKPLHSPACSWACQLSFSDAVHDAHHLDAPILLLIEAGVALFIGRVCTSTGLLRTRAPPLC
jgi:hypothetical protein